MGYFVCLQTIYRVGWLLGYVKHLNKKPPLFAVTVVPEAGNKKMLRAKVCTFIRDMITIVEI